MAKESETIIMNDADGNPVKDPKKAATAEITRVDANGKVRRTLMLGPDAERQQPSSPGGW